MANGITLFKGSNCTLHYGSSGNEIAAVTSYGETGGEADSREQRGLGGKQARVTGTPGVPQINVQILAAPSSKAFRDIAKHQRDQSVEAFELRHAEEVVYAAAASASVASAAIATSGVVTFAGTGTLPTATPNDFGIGMAIKIGTGGSAKYYDILSISKDETPVFTVSNAPGTEVAASAFAIVVPGMKRSTNAKVSDAGKVEVTADGDMTSSITLDPSGNLSDFALISGAWGE